VNISQLTLWSEEVPASPLALRDSERDWQTRVETSPWNFCELLMRHGPVGCCGRTSPES